MAIRWVHLEIGERRTDENTLRVIVLGAIPHVGSHLRLCVLKALWEGLLLRLNCRVSHNNLTY